MSGVDYLLDTNLILGLLKSDPDTLALIGQRPIEARQCAYSAITRDGPEKRDTDGGCYCYDPVVHTLRFPGESDDGFRSRVERADRVAKLLVDACLSNRCVQQYIADPALPEWNVESVRLSPTVRIEYEQASAIGDLGSCLSATASKHWGAGPWVMPLERDDEFFAYRVTYLYRANNLYNRRFEQRQRLKQLLGRRWRPLVETAKRRTKTLFIEELTKTEAVNCIRDIARGACDSVMRMEHDVRPR